MSLRTVFDNYNEVLDAGAIRVNACESCGYESVTPRGVCPECHRDEWMVKEIDPVGTVYSHTEIHVTGDVKGVEAPFTIGITEFDGGARLMVRLRDDDVKIGDEVELVESINIDGKRVPVFETVR